MELKDEEKQRESFGIEITLSRSAETPLPERKPYVKKADKVEKAGKKKPKAAERLDSAEKADTVEKTVTVESAVQTVKPSRSKSRKVSPPAEQASVPAEAPQKREARSDYATQKLAEYKTRTNGKFYDDGLADDKRHFTQYQRGRGNFQQRGGYYQAARPEYSVHRMFYGQDVYQRESYYEKPHYRRYELFGKPGQMTHGTREVGQLYGSTSYGGPKPVD